ncbi:hypothetical protein ACQP2F_24350 [Actinoplanes sp. CA-030573]|uniref:hypothetical protein n=1 Tax=Actinoplanes sp. CA-030573 TaxID=3239898 RepID=UPI003D8F9F19
MLDVGGRHVPRHRELGGDRAGELEQVVDRAGERAAHVGGRAQLRLGDEGDVLAHAAGPRARMHQIAGGQTAGAAHRREGLGPLDRLRLGLQHHVERAGGEEQAGHDDRDLGRLAGHEQHHGENAENHRAGHVLAGAVTRGARLGVGHAALDDRLEHRVGGPPPIGPDGHFTRGLCHPWRPFAWRGRPAVSAGAAPG